MTEIYFDNSATTKVCQEAADAALQSMRIEYGNPSSLYKKGAVAAHALNAARTTMAGILSAQISEVYFTSCGSESNNTVIFGVAKSLAKRIGKRILVSAIEHPSVLEPVKYLQSNGYDVQYIPVTPQGVIDVESLADLLNQETILVSVMHVNNETGAIQPLEKIGQLVKSKSPNAVFHVDGVQSFGRLPIELKLWQADAFSASGHKIHAPKGCGLLWLRQGLHIPAFIMGGGQERNFRSGTENMPGILAFAAAAKKIDAVREQNRLNMINVKEELLTGLANSGLTDWCINCDETNVVAPHIVNISFIGAKSEVLLHYLEEKSIFVSSGSACSSHSNKVSHVLAAMSLPLPRIESALRLSFCPENTVDEAHIVAQEIASAVKDIRMLMGKKRR